MQQRPLCIIKGPSILDYRFHLRKNTNALRSLWLTDKAFMYRVCDNQFCLVHHILELNITEFPSTSLTVADGQTFT